MDDDDDVDNYYYDDDADWHTGPWKEYDDDGDDTDDDDVVVGGQGEHEWSGGVKWLALPVSSLRTHGHADTATTW